MKKMKKRISMLVAIALMLCVFLSGCGSSDADPTTSDAADGSDAGYKIGYITSDPSDGFWKEVLESFTAGLAAGLGFTMAIILMSNIREKLDMTPVRKVFQGVPIAFISAGLMALAFMMFDKSLLTNLGLV